MMYKNKKAIFFTLTAVLILIVIIFLFIWEGEHNREIDEANVQYTKNKVTSDYIKDVEDYYLPSVISVSEKFALQGISKYTGGLYMSLPTDLTNAMLSGHVDNDPANGATLVVQQEKTLPYLINQTFSTLSEPIGFSSFDFIVTSVRHINDSLLQVNSSVNFTIISETITWRNTSDITWRNSRNYSTGISLIGLYSPDYGGPITKNWKSNSTADCLLNQIDPAYICNGIEGMCLYGSCHPYP